MLAEYVLWIQLNGNGNADTNLTNRLTRPKIKRNTKDCLDSYLDENLNPLLIKKQEPQYSEDATTSYGLLVDKSGWTPQKMWKVR